MPPRQRRFPGAFTGQITGSLGERISRSRRAGLAVHAFEQIGGWVCYSYDVKGRLIAAFLSPEGISRFRVACLRVYQNIHFVPSVRALRWPSRPEPCETAPTELDTELEEDSEDEV